MADNKERNMAFQVSMVSQPPVFDSLPVAKILRYPLEKRDYKPYAQSCVCVSAQSLYLRMWAFEVSPMPGSSLRCVLYLYPDTPDRALGVDLRCDGAASCSILEDGEPVKVCAPGGAVRLTPFGGEDLQGVYWGGALQIDVDVLERWGGATRLVVGESFWGNLYKLGDYPGFAHKGSFYPADFAGRPYARESMGEFQIVAY